MRFHEAHPFSLESSGVILGVTQSALEVERADRAASGSVPFDGHRPAMER
jgi:hypothetical protein